MHTETPETVTIDGLTFTRPFKQGAAFNAAIGAPIGAWLVEISKPDGTCGLTIPDARVFDAFGIDPTER